MPADAYMWARIVFDEKFFSAHVPVDSAHHISEKGVHAGVFGVRKFLLDREEVPAGWYSDTGIGVDFQSYTTLAVDAFPESISATCRYVVGPETSSNSWRLLPKNAIPYHVAVVEALQGLNVWEKV